MSCLKQHGALDSHCRRGLREVTLHALPGVPHEVEPHMCNVRFPGFVLCQVALGVPAAGCESAGAPAVPNRCPFRAERRVSASLSMVRSAGWAPGALVRRGGTLSVPR